MKKLMIALAAVAIAMGAQAAACTWKITAGNMFNGTGSTDATAKYSGTAYVIDLANYTQQALFDALNAGTTTISDASAGSITFASGSVSSTGNTFTYGTAGEYYDLYFAVLTDDAIYFSNIKEHLACSKTDTPTSVGFASQNNGTTTFSATTPGETVTAGAWVVPEPTSGLLMLLGMGALALRRRRA